MAQLNEELRKLIEERRRLKLRLIRFKTFYDTHSSLANVLVKRLNRIMMLIQRFETLQDRIEILEHGG